MKYLRKLFYYFFALYLTKKYSGYEREKFEDRNVLERIIFPFVLSEYNPKQILDIGREEYQWFYNKFFIGRKLWTLDRKPTREEFGSSFHVVGDVTGLKKYFENSTFDLIIMNGVFGWGLNDPTAIEKTFMAIYDIMKVGGIFIFGFNDFPDKPMEINKIQALKKFTPLVFKPLETQSFKCVNGEHTYKFYIKQ